MGLRAFCVHAHFYQPPREDPLTGVIPVEPGAAPYRHWNERIFQECYRPNALIGNFQRISFNIGPTLFDWMAGYDPETTAQIVAQDRANVETYGVGNAIAQAYNHTILPLASRADKRTQVVWGIAEFRSRFGRDPQGMWLPETAVDLETLDVLAENGIQFTILAPWQVRGERMDSRQPYLVNLPGGKTISVFLYQQDLSTRISFDPGATINADYFAVNELLPKYGSGPALAGDPQIILVASDGELYGHHQPFREKFLAHLLNGATHGQDIQLTYPALWLKRFPARRSIEILENTSWSCHHGVTRWMGDCACTPNNAWKAPLREALNSLAASLDACYQEALKPYTPNPFALRDQYIQVMLGERSLEDLVNSAVGKKLPEDDLRKIGWLLEAQREKQRMFTSCGWFFDDFGRIEPKNNVAYAAQAVWLTYRATGIDLAPQMLASLRPVRSQRSGLRARAVFAGCLDHARALEDQNRASQSARASNNFSTW